jgi:penicillin-binding protein 1A
MAHKMGVTRAADLHSYPAEAIGGLEKGVTPLEMANVYATLADGGYRNTPIAITKVVFPNGRVDSSWGKPHRVKVLSNGITSEETKILHENVLSGTAGRSAIDCPSAAKTGTTSELVDAWLDGYTPNYSTVVWMGYPNKRVSMTDVHGEPQQGGYLPAEIWHAYMAAVTEGQKCVEFPPATEPLVYQPFFGKFASSGESSQSTEYNGESFEEQENRNKEREKPKHTEHGAGTGGDTETGAPTPNDNVPSEPATPPPVPTPAPTPAPGGDSGGTGGAPG